MGQPQPERQAAAQAFMESLAQLEQTFEPVDELPPQKSPATPDASEQPTPESAQFSLSSFEDAIADLEQFIQNTQSPETP